MKYPGDTFTSADLEDSLLIIAAEPIEFTILNNLSEMVLAPMRYDETEQLSIVDLTGFDVDGIWEILLNLVQQGKDRRPGLSSSDFVSMLAMLKTDGRLFPGPTGNSNPVIAETADCPSLFDFNASGQAQFERGTFKTVIIPFKEVSRQYVEASAKGACIFQFKILKGNTVLWESETHSSGIGRFQFPELLPAKTGSERIIYSWKVRARFDKENSKWTEWSPSLLFKVNIPPEAPSGLKVESILKK